MGLGWVGGSSYLPIIQGCQSYSDIHGYSDTGVGGIEQLSGDTLTQGWGESSYPGIVQGCQSYSDIWADSNTGVRVVEQLSGDYPGMSDLL